MAIVLKDRVKQTTTTTGTASFVLDGSVGGFQSFAAVGNGNITYYAAVDPTTGDWEVGKGTYSTTGPTLTRDTVYESSAAGAKISFGAGAKDVFVTYPAERAIYEEPDGNTLIDGGPLTVVGTGAAGYTSFSAVLAEMYGNVDSFAQMYVQNLNDGSEASADLVAYNDLGDGLTNFVDVGINSSNYSSVDYPIFSAGSSYAFNDGGEMFVGSATDDLVLFAGGVDTTDEAVRIDKTTKNVTTVADVDVGGDLNATGGTFTAAVTTTASMATPGTTEFVTREYVDNATSNGFHVHTPVLVATTGNLTATYSNGTSGVGATLTNSGSQAAISIDGVSLSVADRILVWQQTTGLQNGVYVVTTVGSGATNWVLTRSSDADTSSEGDPNSLGGGDYFFVQSGTTLGFHSFVCTNTSAIVFGTTAITFNEFSSVPQYTGTAPINVSGNVISLTGTVAATNGGTGTSTVTTGDLLYGSGTNTWGKLAAGSAYKSLVMNAGGTQVEWNAVALNQSGSVSGSLPATNGGTGQSAYAVGDMLYSGTTNTLDKLTGNTTTTKKFLGQTGTGSASQAPVWEQPAASDITGLAPSATTDTTDAANITSGTLPSARLTGSYTGITGVGTLTAGTWNASTIGATYGGTGVTSYAIGDLLYADTTTSLAKLADVATGNALISGGVGAAPSWGKIGLATHVSGTLPIANGGTNGSASPAAGAVAYGTGTSYDFTAAGTSGQVLTSAGAAAPTWTSQSAISVGTATNIAGGAANQVLYQSGSGATTFVTAPTTAGTSLTWNGSAFVWQTAGAATIQNDTSTNATYYPTFATATSGSFSDARVSSTKLTFNPNTGTFGATAFQLGASGIISPNGGTAVAADSAFPSVANALVYTLGLGPSGNDGHILGMTWSNVGTYGAQIWVDTDPTNRMAIRSRSNVGVWNDWWEVLTSGNYGSYSTFSGTVQGATIRETASTAAAANFGTVAASWAGGAYPTLYSDAADRWVMHINPHISYVQNGVNGYTGSSNGACVRMASNPSASANWDMGVLHYIGSDIWSVSRQQSTNAAITANASNYVVIGGNWGGNSYNTVSATRLMFGSGSSDSQNNYYIGTNIQNYGGNYTKLDLSWHTGIRMGAQASYGGVRIFDSEDFGTQLFTVGETDTNVRVTNRLIAANWTTSGRNYSNEWIEFSNYTGLYSPLNAAHFYPNNGTYGAWLVQGSRNSWRGINFESGMTLMMNDNACGVHRESGGWRYYVEANNLYCGGNITAYWSDERLKENFQAIGREAITILGQINAFRFNWNSKVAELGMEIPVGKEEIGCIAQHVQRALPDAVNVNKAGGKAKPDGTTDGDFDYLTINYDRITPLLVESANLHEQDIQAMQAEIRALRSALQAANLI